MDTTIEKQGYKYTEEFGYIPKDWEVATLNSCGECIIGLTYSPDDVRPYGTLVLRSSNIQDNSLSYTDNVYVNKDIPERLVIREGDILVCVRNGSRDLIGKSALISENKAKMTFGAFMSVYRTDKNSKFIFQLFQSNIIKEQIKSGLGATINQITNSTMNKFVFPKPSEPEQEKIAEVLGDVDELIENTQQLIEKKKNLKIAAMQKLLTPKKDWETKELGLITENIYQPPTISTDMFKASGYPVFGANGIIGYYDKYNHKTSQVVITCRGNTCGTVNMTYPYSWITGNAMVVNIDNIDFNKKFLFYFLSNKDLSTLITGSGQPQIVRNSLKKLKISYPSKREEQDKIAAILSDMDNEIEILEQELVKYKNLKTGMMQELLTGKVRLI